MSGVMGKKDVSMAKDWLIKSANSGSPDAQYYLGSYILSGDIAGSDESEGLSFLYCSGLNGKVEALTTLGVYFLQKETPQDVLKAYSFFSVAAERGYAKASELFGSLTKNLQQSQIRKAAPLTEKIRSKVVPKWQEEDSFKRLYEAK